MGEWYVWSLFCSVLHSVVSSFCNHLAGEERAGCFNLIVFKYLLTVNVLCLFLAVSCVGLQCGIVTFPGRTHLLFHGIFA